MSRTDVDRLCDILRAVDAITAAEAAAARHPTDADVAAASLAAIQTGFKVLGDVTDVRVVP